MPGSTQGDPLVLALDELAALAGEQDRARLDEGRSRLADASQALPSPASSGRDRLI